MYEPTSWTTERSLQFFANAARNTGDNFLARFNWGGTPVKPAIPSGTFETEGDVDIPEVPSEGGFTIPELDAIYAEVIDKIPGSATKVLELGCGDGRFAQALHTARPALGYRGIDIVPANVAAAQGALPSGDFQIGNLWEYLTQATMDWDFIVSIGCAFSCTNEREQDSLFRLIDSKATKGFFILGHAVWASGPFVDARMAEAVASSTGVTASYSIGVRNFLTPVTLKDILVPFFIHRSGTTAEAPLPNSRWKTVELGNMNRVLARLHARAEGAVGNPPPIQFEGVTTTGGLVTGTSPSLAIDTWIGEAP